MITAILLLLLQPEPPPPAKQHEAAIALWMEHPASESWKREAIDAAVIDAAADGVSRAAGLRPGGRRWLEKVDALRPRLASRVSADRDMLDRNAAACAAARIAYSLSAEEIGEVSRFMSTPVGKRFWGVAGIGSDSLRACYAKVLELHATDEDLRAVGLKPRKQPWDRFRPGEIVN
jgi:hypothetical protein